MRLHVHDRTAFESHATGIGRKHPGDAVEQGRLAGTVGTDQPQDLAPIEVERHVVEGTHTAEAQAYILDFEQAHDAGTFSGGAFCLPRRWKMCSKRLASCPHTPSGRLIICTIRRMPSATLNHSPLIWR